MNQMDLRKLVAHARKLLAEAPSKDHERISAKLEGWATERGFGIPYKDLGGLRPDVLRGDVSERLLFVGDAKVSDNEGPTTTSTQLRLLRYIHAFASLLSEGACDGGIIAVATDSHEAAMAWSSKLAWLVGIYDLVGDGGGEPSFTVTELGDGVWVTWW